MKLSHLFVLSIFAVSLQGKAESIFSLEQQPNIGTMTAQSYTHLCEVADGALAYLNKGEKYDAKVIHGGKLSQPSITLTRVKETLAFICQVVAEDKAQERESRLADAAFIAQHFTSIRWRPNKEQAAPFAHKKPLLQKIPDDKILLTKYYIKKAKGSPIKTAETPHALYAIPHDEQDLSLEEAEEKKSTLTRFHYTKQQVLSGILQRKKLAKPLIWLSRDDLEDTLMQGTVKIETSNDSSQRYFNVHRNNGIGYQRNVKKQQQQRYWYFKQTSSVMGYGKDAHYKIPIHPLVTVAGDLEFFGLGKLILLTHQGQSRLTVLADTGGAFADNQYQLDYLGGYFFNWQDYIKTYRHFPDYFEARLLLLKPQAVAVSE